MTERVSDTASNRRDNIANFAEILRNAPARQKIFNAVYFGKKSFKTVKEIAKSTGINEKRVTMIAKALVSETLFEQGRERINGTVQTIYRKKDFVVTNKTKILSLAKGNGLKNYHTKTNPKSSLSVKKVIIKTPFKLQYRFISIGDITQFSKIKNIKTVPEKLTPERLPEKEVKRAFIRILKEEIDPKDWGGEINDIFITRATLFGRTRRIAFALKGPSKSGPLVPGKMGKNGDQIQRLFASPADIFFVQYEEEIKESIIDLMENLAIAKAALSKEIFFGVIDKADTYRLRIAYAKEFKN